MPITTDQDREYFGTRSGQDQVGVIEGFTSRFDKTYTGEPDVLAEELVADAAVQAADTVLLTIPHQLGVAYCTKIMESITGIARELG